MFSPFITFYDPNCTPKVPYRVTQDGFFLLKFDHNHPCLTKRNHSWPPPDEVRPSTFAAKKEAWVTGMSHIMSYL